MAASAHGLPSLTRARVVCRVVLASNRSHSSLIPYAEHYISFIDFNDNLDHEADREVELHYQWKCPGACLVASCSLLPHA